jgi:hypothetical protein
MESDPVSFKQDSLSALVLELRDHVIRKGVDSNEELTIIRRYQATKDSEVLSIREWLQITQ